jgi:pyruvate/2-oxoglutarate dehydrogenase complex dihydrolipoamide acyltransferase (E2) component
MRYELILPELGLGEQRVTACAWLSDRGTRVYEGDRLLEVHAGEVTIDLPSPGTGILIKQCVHADEPLQTGQVLGIVEESD